MAHRVTYQLIDFGKGRKLESLGDYRIDRPSPAAHSHHRSNPSNWKDVDAVFDAASKRWIFHRAWPEDMRIDCGRFQMPVRPTPYGHIGVFPEQAENWDWLSRFPEPQQGAKLPTWGLNLFGYTGASTMAMVSAGMAVAHVDAAKPNVESAKRVAQINGWQDHPIRYLVDDAAKFVAREVRRGRKYQTIVLDPPAYGHSGKGHTWRLERDLWPLLDNCLQLLNDSSGACRLLMTGHSPEIGCREIVDYLSQTTQAIASSINLDIASSRSQLIDQAGRGLDSGFLVRATFTRKSF